MPIPGLTDKAPSFKEVGRLRKGAPKKAGLKDLTYFRPDFRPDEGEVAELFYDVYGHQPNRINVRLAFPNIDDCWDAWFTVYNSAGMLGKAGGIEGREGWWWVYLRDNKSGQVLVKDGFPEREFDPTIPVYAYKNKKGQDVAVYAKPDGKLRVLVPELRRPVYLTVVTHSWYDIGRISEQLNAIQRIAANVGQTLPMVPLVLSRRPEQVSVNFDGHKHMEEKWIINIEPRNDWGEAHFKLLEEILPGKALPHSLAYQAAQLPAQIADADEYGDDDDIQPDDFAQPEDLLPAEPPADDPPAEEPKPEAPSTNGSRPFPPQIVKAKLSEAFDKYQEKGWEPEDKGEKDPALTANIVRMNLEQVFAGDADTVDKRHTVLLYLWGEGSTKELDHLQLVVTKRWLNAKPDSGGEFIVSPYSAQEARDIYRAALKSEGQMELAL